MHVIEALEVLLNHKHQLYHSKADMPKKSMNAYFQLVKNRLHFVT